MEELAEAEQVHMQTLERWLDQQAKMTEDIGVARIERAQRYYDGDALRHRAQLKLEVLTQNLQGLMEVYNERTAEQQQAESDIMNKKSDSSATDNNSMTPEEDFMARVTRLNDLTGEVCVLQEWRDQLHNQYAAALETWQEEKALMEALEREHRLCTRNCSVIRAKPYFDARSKHEELVEQQMKHMDSLRRRLLEVTIRWREEQYDTVEDNTPFELQGPQVLATSVELQSPQAQATSGREDDSGFFSCSEDEGD